MNSKKMMLTLMIISSLSIATIQASFVATAFADSFIGSQSPDNSTVGSLKYTLLTNETLAIYEFISPNVSFDSISIQFRICSPSACGAGYPATTATSFAIFLCSMTWNSTVATWNQFGFPQTSYGCQGIFTDEGPDPSSSPAGDIINITLDASTMSDFAISAYWTVIFVIDSGEMALQTLESTPPSTVNFTYTRQNWVGNGTAFNYTYSDACAVTFYNVSATGTDILGGNLDDEQAPFTSAFDFTYFGNLYPAGSTFWVCSNGQVNFNGDECEFNDFDTSPYVHILILGFDQYTVSPVFTDVRGTAPNRIQIIQFYNRRYSDNGERYSVEIQLHETTNQIDFVYESQVPSDSFVLIRNVNDSSQVVYYSNQITTPQFPQPLFGVCFVYAANVPPPTRAPQTTPAPGVIVPIAQLNASVGPSDPDYQMVWFDNRAGCPLEFTSIDLSLDSDQVSDYILLPFDFTHWNYTYITNTSLAICGDGSVIFDNEGWACPSGEVGIPQKRQLFEYSLGFTFEEFNTEYINYLVDGVAPYRRLIVQWRLYDDHPFFYFLFQMQLFETTNEIRYQVPFFPQTHYLNASVFSVNPDDMSQYFAYANSALLTQFQFGKFSICGGSNRFNISAGPTPAPTTAAPTPTTTTAAPTPAPTTPSPTPAPTTPSPTPATTPAPTPASTTAAPTSPAPTPASSTSEETTTIPETTDAATTASPTTAAPGNTRLFENQTTSSGGLSNSIIATIIVLIILVICIAIAAVVIYSIRKRKQKMDKDLEQDLEVLPTGAFVERSNSKMALEADEQQKAAAKAKLAEENKKDQETATPTPAPTPAPAPEKKEESPAPAAEKKEETPAPAAPTETKAE